MKSVLLATGAILIASTAPAFAQDAAAPTVATPDAPTFTGPRAEIFGGWDRVDVRTHIDDGVTSSTDHSHKSGGTAGALVGYDMAFGNLVGGVFGSYALSTTKECAETGGCLKAGREIEGGARLGYRFGDKTLGYVKGAYVNGRIRDTALDIADNRDGWRAGAGVEYALNKHAYVKAEYDYTRYNKYNFGDDTTDASLRFDRNQVLGGFGVRF